MKAIIEIKGGFGNQIFQFAFANYLRELGYKVKVSLDHLNSNTPGIIKREIVVSPSTFGFKEAYLFNVKLFRFLHKISESKKASYVYKIIIDPLFHKYSKLSDFESSNSKQFSYFDGYWQDVKILEKEKKFIIESLKNVNILKEGFEKKIKKGSTLLLVRRSDYLELEEDLSLTFYENALKFCKKNITNFNYEVFTDDIKWVENQDCFFDALKVHPPSDDPTEILKLFCKMLNFENYVVGNSTFSLIAAVLSENDNSQIIVSNPWFRNSRKFLNFKSKWVKIKNQ